MSIYELIFSVILLKGIVLLDRILILSSLLVNAEKQHPPGILAVTRFHTRLCLGDSIRAMLHHQLDDGRIVGILILLEPEKGIVDRLVSLSHLVIGLTSEPICLGIVITILLACIKHPDRSCIILSLYHITCEACHGCLVRLILFYHLAIHGIRLIIFLRIIVGLSQIEGYVLHILLVVLAGSVKGLLQPFYLLLVIVHIVIDAGLPPIESGVYESGFLRLVNPDGLIDAGHRTAIFLLIAIDAAHEQPALNVVRS